MTVREALSEGVTVLRRGISGSPFLDASLLLAAAAGVDSTSILSDHLRDLDPAWLGAYRDSLARRASGESVAVILGRKEFYGRDFLVTRDVLVPRPDTETLVAEGLREIDRIGASRPGAVRVHDACTGSGCVGLTLAAERPGCELSLSDLSPAAIGVARRNAELILGRSVPVFPGDLLSDVTGTFDLVTANPPYVASALIPSLAACGVRDPYLALDGGADGLGLFRRLVPQAAGRLAPGGALVVEIGEEQGAAVSGLMKASGFSETSIWNDLAGSERVVLGRMP
ncbi:MAG: peptide chain release factor N(5)-glutamine methyltransferase [Spirochaetes bacterium]|nr:peptide chain release factor N(5)-glutamine methyltransferase [Spirochaetota bacterium]